MKIQIIREGKVPPDSRVPLTPKQCRQIAAEHPEISIQVAPSPNRCYTDVEYQEQGVTLAADPSDADILMGVKEVPIAQLVPRKTYFFFSHTIKEQAYNRKLLLACLQRGIRLLDYEVLTGANGKRVIAFGKFAGMVGAHNALWTYGQRTGLIALPRLRDLRDYAEAKALYAGLTLPPIKIVLTGTGRVGRGAALVLRDMGIREVTPEEFLHQTFDEFPVFTILRGRDYARRSDHTTFDKADFFANPAAYDSVFRPYYRVADVMINGIYWDNAAPAFFTAEEMRLPEFKIRVIADVTCDIAPVSSIPSTLEASTIANPIFGYDVETMTITEPHQPDVVDMMTIDNLPNELPRDASRAFGKQFIEHVLPEVMKEYVHGQPSAMLERATVCRDGKLGKHFQYLSDYVAGA